MDNAHRFQVEETLKDVLDIGIGLRNVVFISKVTFGKDASKISSFAKLVDGVAVVSCSKVLQASDDVGMFELLDDVELFPEKLFDTHFFNCFELGYLYCYFFVLLCVVTQVDCRKSPRSQHMFGINDIVVHAFMLIFGGA